VVRLPAPSRIYGLRQRAEFLAGGGATEARISRAKVFLTSRNGEDRTQVSAQGADIGPVDDPEPTTPKTSDLDGYPLLKALKPLLSENRSAEVFESSLDLLITHLETLGKN